MILIRYSYIWLTISIHDSSCLSWPDLTRYTWLSPSMFYFDYVPTYSHLYTICFVYIRTLVMSQLSIQCDIHLSSTVEWIVRIGCIGGILRCSCSARFLDDSQYSQAHLTLINAYLVAFEFLANIAGDKDSIKERTDGMAVPNPNTSTAVKLQVPYILRHRRQKRTSDWNHLFSHSDELDKQTPGVLRKKVSYL